LKRLAHLSILVVEDEIDSRELIELVLASEGASVRTAADAFEALALIEEMAPDVVLSDIGMPGRDGYWLCGQVRARRPKIATIALTAFSSVEEVERAMASGFDQHFAKPVDAERLVQALTVCPRIAA
jgi:CheY-like chemotaxis protein